MPNLSADSLKRALSRAFAAAAAAADTQPKDGRLSPAERSKLPTEIQNDISASAAQTVAVSDAQKAFDAAVSAAVSKADTNGDQSLSDFERGRITGSVADNIRAVTALPSTPSTPAGSTAAAFGINGTISASKVTLKTILKQGLSGPTGIAVNPRDKSVWVVNRGSDSSVVIDRVGTSGQVAKLYRDSSDHFMNNPMAIAFSTGFNEFATVQESDNDYNGHAAHGNMFMGPTVFTANRSIYEGGAASHLDMLHHSPNSVGIAAGANASKREYWVFNGNSGSIDRYFFNQPHQLGGDDHRDGTTFRYAAGALKRVAGVPGHLAFDASTGELFIADTGNGRIARLDTKAQGQASPIAAYHNETPLYGVKGPQVSSVTARGAVTNPSGLIIFKGQLVVADYATGHIKVFTKSGQQVGDLDTGLGAKAITGIAAGPGGELFVLDAKKSQLVQISVKA